MDKKEASFILANIDRRVCDDELNEALDMAIKALEQEPKTDTWSIKDVANTFKKHGLIVEQAPCEDAISRQAVLDLAKKGVLVSNGNYESVCKAINELPSVNPIEPCGDAIDRAEAIKIASGYCHPANVAKELAKLPPVNPTKTGHCKDCKWWKDSDGTYCRGVHAESKCPINRKEVYEGNGY